MKIKYVITGVDCPNCAAKLSSMIEAKEGIESAKINFLTERLTIETSLDEAAAYSLVTSLAKSFSKAVKIEK